MKFSVFIIIVVFICEVNYCLGYPWPIQPFTQPHPITGTFGEFRTPSGNLGYHFHGGVDIAAPAGTTVYPSGDGRVRRWRNVEMDGLKLGIIDIFI